MSITHTRKDGELMRSVPIPAAGQTAYSDAVNILQHGGIENAVFQIDLPDLPNLAAGKNVSVKLQDSADGKTWSDIAGLEALKVIGATGGGKGGMQQIRIPMYCEQYVRMAVIVDASAGDNTAQSAELVVCV